MKERKLSVRKAGTYRRMVKVIIRVRERQYIPLAVFQQIFKKGFHSMAAYSSDAENKEELSRICL
jgi:hypothetical protein